MDANSLISNKKIKKHQEGEGMDESSIRICDLPDPILQLIISSLSIKEAVQTGVLSKKWVYLWRGVSKMELKEGALEKRQQSIVFVRRLLEVCDWSNLKKFFLSCKVGEDAPEIIEWLHGFVNPKIQELILVLEGMEEPLVFPVHLFTCATLTKFQLRPPIQLSCEALLTVLQKSPRLRVIEFEAGVYLPNDSSYSDYILDPLPMCFMENLKTIKIGSFAKGRVVDEELRAIQILLQEAAVLERLHIDCSSTRSKWLKKLRKQIIGFVW